MISCVITTVSPLKSALRFDHRNAPISVVLVAKKKIKIGLRILEIRPPKFSQDLQTA